MRKKNGFIDDVRTQAGPYLMNVTANPLPVRTKPLTTREAFEMMINERGVYHKLNITKSAVHSLRNNFKNGLVSLDRMEELLAKAGWKVKQEKLWVI